MSRTFLGNKIRGLRNRIVGLFQPDDLTLRCIPYKGLHFVAPINHDVGWRLYKDGLYEESELTFLEAVVQSEDNVIDVGANIGIYSLVLARKAFAGYVTAIEPGPLSGRCLQANIELNGFQNVAAESFVVSDIDGEVDFSLSDDETYSSMVSTGRKSAADRVRIRSVTLDTLSNGQRIDIIKIDVEGAELKVLSGGDSLLTSPDRRPRALLVELNAENQSVYGYGPDDVVEYLNRKGYDAYSLTDGGIEPGYIPSIGCEDYLFWDRALGKPSTYAPRDV